MLSLAACFSIKLVIFMEPISDSSQTQSTTSTLSATSKPSEVQQIITKACSEVTFPIKVTELVTFSNSISSTLAGKYNIFDTLFTLNYEAAQKEISEVRHKLLHQFKGVITDDLSIQRCLKLITPAHFNGRISQEYIDTLENYYQFTYDYEERGQQISECFDDLLMLMMKLSEEYMKSLELMETWKNNLDEQMQTIKDQLRKYLAQCFYSFKKDVKRKVKKILNESKYQPSSEEKVELIRKSYNDYKKNLLRELKVSKWLLPEGILQSNLQMQEWDLKNQIGHLLHNKHDFVLKTKKKISEVFQQTKNHVTSQFDYLNEAEKKNLVDIMVYCLSQQRNIGKEDLQQLRFLIVSLESKGFKYEWNKVFTPKNVKPVWNCSSEDANLRTMIDLYLLFSQNYTSAKRNLLKDIFRHLNNFKYGYSNFKVLLNLENRNLPITNKILQKLRNQDVGGANKEIIQYLGQFLMQDNIKIKDRLPYFSLQKISDPSSNSRVVTICISGFTSQADIPNESWRKLIGNTEGEIYSLGWESKSQKEISTFALGQLERLVTNQMFFQHPVLTVASIAKTLVDSYRQNPFFEAFEHAVFSGQLLGRLIMQVFPGYLINLIAFSLGTELVKETLKVLKANKRLDMINQVMMIGGCADKSQLQGVLADTHLDVTNCYIKDDHVLKWLFKICKPFVHPIGRNSVEGAHNINCSKFVDGHNKYRECMDELRKRIELDDDTYYATEI